MTDSREKHAGVRMTGDDGADGPKAFYILIEARPGKQDEVVQMLGGPLRGRSRKKARA